MWGRCGVSGFLYDFDVYQGKNVNVDKSILGMSSQIVKSLCESLPSGHNFKVFADNFFTSLPLVESLKREGMFFVGTIRTPRLKNCPLKCEKDLKKEGRGAIDYRVEVNRDIVAVRWFDNKAVTLVSSFVAVDPIEEISRYDRSARKKISVKQPGIVRVYNQFMGGVDKLDMVCSLYKQTIRSRRWYIYIWLHSITISVVNA